MVCNVLPSLGHKDNSHSEKLGFPSIRPAIVMMTVAWIHLRDTSIKHKTENNEQDLPHFICQDAVDAVIMQLDKPIEAFQLVRVHFAFFRQIGGLCVQSHGATLGLCGFH